MSSSGWWREPEDLDETQQRIVALPSDGRYLITGKPGSGKTNLLVLRAAYLIRAGYADIKILTWGRLIKEFIASGGARHGLDDTQLTTFRTWALEALHEAGINTGDIPHNFNDMIDYLIRALGEAQASGELATYDAMVLDEVQDYPRFAIEIVSRSTIRTFFAGDENQRIFGRAATLAQVEELVDQTVRLPYHYRNGRRICAVAQAIKRETDYTSTSRYDEEALPSRVALVRAASLEEQVEHLKAELISQLRSYPNEWLGVIVPLRDDLDDVIEMLREDEVLEPLCQFQTRNEGNEPLSDDKPIIVSTIHAAKGLEYRAAHILAMEGISEHPPQNRRNIAYTAVTRAKTTLFGYHTRPLAGWLRSAFNAGQDPPPTPTLGDLPW